MVQIVVSALNPKLIAFPNPTLFQYYAPISYRRRQTSVRAIAIPDCFGRWLIPQIRTVTLWIVKLIAMPRHELDDRRLADSLPLWLTGIHPPSVEICCILRPATGPYLYALSRKLWAAVRANAHCDAISEWYMYDEAHRGCGEDRLVAGIGAWPGQLTWPARSFPSAAKTCQCSYSGFQVHRE